MHPNRTLRAFNPHLYGIREGPTPQWRMEVGQAGMERQGSIAWEQGVGQGGCLAHAQPGARLAVSTRALLIQESHSL